MSWLDETLADFGRRLGVENLAFGSGGFVQMALSQGGMLGIAHGEEEVKIWLTRPVAHGERDALEKALAECDFRKRAPFAVHAGLHKDDGLAFLARIPERGFTTPALEQALDVLTRMHERVRAR
jgi:type III secretion system chaperone SycN